MAMITVSNQDPTLQAVELAIQKKGNAGKSRPYLGMSSIGHPCMRKGWMDFRWCSLQTFDAATIKRFDDGHVGEAIQADRLRMLDEINLRTVDPSTGQQFELIDCGGHFRGHPDGKISGLIQAPKTLHIWEHKQVAEKKFASLKKIKEKVGEKKALQEWDEIYYAQAIIYMHYTGLTRHYLTCATPGGRDTVSVRTNADSKSAEGLASKAMHIICGSNPTGRISENPSWWVCKMCNHYSVCHEKNIPEVNCRTCCHSTPKVDDDLFWECALWPHAPIPEKAQRIGCIQHLFIPDILPFLQVDANAQENWVAYKVKDKIIRNGANIKNGYSSYEIKASSSSLGIDLVDQIRIKFEARIVENDDGHGKR